MFKLLSLEVTFVYVRYLNVIAPLLLTEGVKNIYKVLFRYLMYKNAQQVSYLPVKCQFQGANVNLKVSKIA